MTTTALTTRNEIDRYVGEVARYPVIGRDEEQRLARRFRDDGDVAAAHELVVSNLRFVIKIAHEYRGYGLKLLDVIQEGNMGLMQAVKKFDPDKGYRLISYAVWWIRAHIQSFVMKSWSLVKLGSGRVRRKLFFKLRSERSRVQQDAGGREDVDVGAQLAHRLGVTEEDLDEMEVRMAARDFSLDAPVGEDAGVTHVEMLSTPEDQETAVARSEERQLLDGAIEAVSDTLNDKEHFILENRLLEEDPQTLAAIGAHFGVTRERVRQIEKGLIGKLRDAAGVVHLGPPAPA